MPLSVSMCNNLRLARCLANGVIEKLLKRIAGSF